VERPHRAALVDIPALGKVRDDRIVRPEADEASEE